MSESRQKIIDVLIIGGGVGGLTTAITLARKGREVVVLEEGAPKSEAEAFSLKEIISDYRFGGLGLSLGRPKINFAEAKVLGGGSAINTGYYFRAKPDSLERIAVEWNVKNLTANDLKSHYEFIENEWAVAVPRESDPFPGNKFIPAADALGLQAQRARFFHQYGEGKIIRKSCYDVWRDELGARGAKVFSRQRATRIFKKGSSWYVDTIDHLGKKNVFACTHLFVGAGATETPALLRRSGIRNNIGNNLRFHAYVRAVAKFPWDINAHHSLVAPWVFTKDQFAFGHTPSLPAMIALIDPSLQESAMHESHRMLCFYASVPTSSRGRVRNFGFRAPIITTFLGDKEQKDLMSARTTLLHFLQLSGASEIHMNEKMPLIQSVHLFGSAPMGERTDRCAVDSFGVVHGYENLRISDASIIGSSPGLNPQGFIMAIAHRNACQFLLQA